MSEKEKAEKTQAEILRDAFQAIKSRPPKTDRELEEWLASDEGKVATAFDLSSGSRWGETGRS
jgi:hypothetical protein